MTIGELVLVKRGKGLLWEEVGRYLHFEAFS